MSSPGVQAWRRHGVVAGLALAGLLLWIYVGARYSALSALPLDPARLLLHAGLLTLGHYLIGRAVFFALARAQRPGADHWAWCILLGHGTAPAVLWIADQLGSRAAGWGVIAALVLAGLVLAVLVRTRAQENESPAYARAIPALTLLLCLAASSAIGMDHIVYLRPDPQGVVLTPPEDNFVHAGLSLEWSRQEPCRYVWESFTPEAFGLSYHYLTDVQLAAWIALCGGDHLEVIHRERALLQGLALLIGLYLLASALLESRAWALVTVGLFSALPFWFLGCSAIPERESLQRLWISFTFENGAAFGAGFLASVWLWLQRGQPGFARIALVLAGLLLLAKLNFAILAWACAACLVLYLRPRAWIWWLASLFLLGLGLVALEPHGPDIFHVEPEWAPGRFWSSLASYRGPFVRDGRYLANFVDWIVVGLALLCVGALSAGLAFRRWWPGSPIGRALLLAVASSWVVYLVYVSSLWFLNGHQTAFQFLPWLAVLSTLVGLVGIRLALRRWLAGRRSLRLCLSFSGIVLWGLVLGRAYATTDGFAQCQWTTFPLANETWEVLTWLRTSTPRTARVLAPFESPLLDAVPSPYAISGVAGRRAVDEHFNVSMWLPGLAEHMAQRKQMVAEFYRDPRPEQLRALVAEWQLDYVILSARQAAQMPGELGRSVHANAKWTVLEVRSH